MATGTEKRFRDMVVEAESISLDGTAVSSSAAELNILDGVTATAAEINAAADVSSRLVSVADATTYTALAANSGKTHVMPNLTASCTITLPTPAAGIEFEFIYGGVAADAQNWVIDTGSDTNYFIGGLMFADHDSADAEIAPIAGDGNSNSILTVVTPTVGTRVKVICDGTLWVLTGYVNSATIPSFADQA